MNVKPAMPWKTTSARVRGWISSWSRNPLHHAMASEPIRSVTMHEDDLDHLATLHRMVK